MKAAPTSWRSLGDILVERGLLSQDDLERALAEETATDRRLADILVQRGLVSGHDITSALMEQMAHFGDGDNADARPKLTVVDAETEAVVQEDSPEPAQDETQPPAHDETEPPGQADPEPLRVAPAAAPVATAEVQLSRAPDDVIREADEQRMTAESRLGMLDGIEDGLGRIRAELDAQELATPSLVHELEATQARVQDRKNALAQEIVRLEQTRVAVETTSAELDELRAALAVKLNDLSDLQATAAIWNTRVAELETEVDGLVARVEVLARQLAQLVEDGAPAPGIQAVTEVYARPDSSHAAEHEEEPETAEPTVGRRSVETHLLFVPKNEGFDLIERDGPPPAVGDLLEDGGTTWVVTKIGPSPLPYDDRRCVFFSAT